MRIRYFEDTDTLFIELKPGKVAESRDLDENTLLDLDDQGRGVGYCAGARDRARRTQQLLVRPCGGLARPTPCRQRNRNDAL